METQAEYQVTTPERNALAEFSITPEKVAVMAKEYMTLTVPPEDTKAYKVARSALTVCVTTRTGTDKRRKQLGEDARMWITECNTAAKDLIAPLAPVEEHLRAELQTEDDRKAAIRAEEERVERERIEAHRKRIAEIQASALVPPTMNSESISTIRVALDSIDTSESAFEEFWTEATKTKDAALNALIIARSARVVWEKDEEERKAESERLDKVSAEQEEKKKWLLEAQLAAEAEREALKKQKTEFEAAKQAEINKQDAVAKAAQDAIEASKTAKARALQAEKDAIAKKEAEEADRLARIDAAKVEKLRRELLKPDKEKFEIWLDTVAWGDPPEMANIVAKQIVDATIDRFNEAIAIGTDEIEAL